VTADELNLLPCGGADAPEVVGLMHSQVKAIAPPLLESY
jgi:hypothetical protein